MKYSSKNLPIQCKMSQSTWYKGAKRGSTPVGVLWHCTGANNPTLKRYVQPDDNDPNRDALIKLIGKNRYGNDWNHIDHEAGLNCWIGKLEDGSVATVQTGEWTIHPWGCGGGNKGSCNGYVNQGGYTTWVNQHWVQFEICEDGLTDKTYFNAVYKEACEITAYICKLYSINPEGTYKFNGINVPTILCHQDSYRLGLGGNHSDVYNWFNKHGKTMDDVRHDVAAILAADQPDQPVKSYEVVTNINRYKTVADAKAQANSAGKYELGTYYIYNKYPNGKEGMFNISKDATGNSAGSWINPSENKKAEPAKPEMYRVRITWKDVKGQIGAYTILENAKKKADENADKGYKVFNNAGQVVYTPTVSKPSEPQPVDPKPSDPKPEEPKPTQPTFPTSTKIIGYVVDDNYRTNQVKAYKKIKSIYTDIDINIIHAFFDIGPKYRIDPMMMISQSILETGWFRFNGSSVKPEQHNYCGLGATGGRVSGAAFDTIELGVIAQAQHLYAYGCKDELPEGAEIVDPRFKYVSRGKSEDWEGLAGKWAVPGYDTGYGSMQAAIDAGATYGQHILTIKDKLLAQEVTAEEVKNYFNPEPEEPEQPIEPPVDEPKPDEPKKPEEPTTPEDPKQDEPDDDTDDKEKQLNGIQALLIKCIEAIIRFIKSLFKKN